MFRGLKTLFQESSLGPQVKMTLWPEQILALHIFSDILIILASLSLCAALVYFVKHRKDMEFTGVVWPFVAFVLAHAISQVIDLWGLWGPQALLTGISKFLVGIFALAAGIKAWRTIPLALVLPSHLELTSINERLQEEVAEKKRIEGELRESKANLEFKVAERSRELIEVNKRLEKEQAYTKRLNRDLKRRVDELEAIFDMNPIGICVAQDSDCSSIRVNTAGAKILGISPECNASRSGPGGDRLPFKFLKNGIEVLPQDLPMQQAALQGKEVRDLDYSIYHTQDQILTHIFICAVPLFDEDKKVRGSLAIIMDITESKRAERELVKAKEEADQANRAKSVFLANMGHEIRTPLGIIMGFADLTLEAAQDPYVIKGLQTIKRNTKQLSAIIDDTLDLSKIEAGKLEIEILRFELIPFIEEIADLMGSSARDKGLSFTVKYVGTLPLEIETDPTRLKQILINLISNAIKFTGAGSITVTFKAKVPEDLEMETVLIVDVTDTGIGLSEEQMSKLFRPFSQGDPSMTRRFGGTGLGLTLSKKLAQALGGDISISKSAPNEGSTFTLKILSPTFVPFSFINQGHRQNLEKMSDGPAILKGQHHLKGLRILLAEDSPDNQLLITRFLKLAGASVDVAEDGLVAIEKALKNEYDVILMDIQMPNCDGHQAMKKLRAKGISYPILALTAHALMDEKIKSLNAGFNDYLTKPVQQKNLVQTLKRYYVAREREQEESS